MMRLKTLLILQPRSKKEAVLFPIDGDRIWAFFTSLDEKTSMAYYNTIFCKKNKNHIERF